MRALLLSGLGLSLVLAASAAFATDTPDAAAKLTCPVSGKPIDAAVTSDFDGGKVCFCCTKCKAKFDADSAKFGTKANLQLAASGQAKQTACPFSGEATDASTTVKVAGVDVKFCCSKCKAKAVAATPAEQIELVFGSKPFAKAFKVGKE